MSSLENCSKFELMKSEKKKLETKRERNERKTSNRNEMGHIVEFVKSKIDVRYSEHK